MTYCIIIERGGIGEEDCVLHEEFDTTPTHEQIEDIIYDADIGFKKDYCRFSYYIV
jgi:hypothetical protein